MNGADAVPAATPDAEAKPGRYAEVRLYDPEGYTPDGDMFITPDAMAWHQVPYVSSSGCGHQEQMCGGCVDTWGIDHEVRLPGGAMY